MDFSYTEVQQMLQDSVKKYVVKNYDFDTRSKIIDSDSGYSEENWKLFAELGWLGIAVSEKNGGFGGSSIETMLIMEEFGIHPNNFALARAIAGDPSDNLKGVPRVGLKTVSNKFKFLSSELEVELETVLEHCNTVEKQLQVHKNIKLQAQLWIIQFQ